MLFFLYTSIIYLIHSHLSLAVCPVCIIGSGISFGMAEYLGLNIFVITFILSSMFMSSTIWVTEIIKKKLTKVNKLLIGLISLSLHYIALLPFFKKHNAFSSEYTIYNINAYYFATLIGGLIVILNFLIYNFMKKHNKNKPYFPYQKVVMLFLSIITISLFFHFHFK